MQLLVLGTGAVVIHLSFGSARQAVDILVNRAMETIQRQVSHRLEDILAAAPAANRRLEAALKAGSAACYQVVSCPRQSMCMNVE